MASTIRFKYVKVFVTNNREYGGEGVSDSVSENVCGRVLFPVWNLFYYCCYTRTFCTEIKLLFVKEVVKIFLVFFLDK